MDERRQWEYQVIELGSFWIMPKRQQIETVLNELGAEGWELVSTHSQYGSNTVRLTLKRPLDRSARRQRNWPG